MSKSVELGYKVIDDYLQQGQRTAARLNAGALTAEAMATEAQDLGTRVARYASDFFGAWMELLELAAAGRAARPDLQRPGGNEAAGAAPGAPDASASRAPGAATPPGRLLVEVDTSRRVRVRLDVHAERIRGALRAHALRSVDPAVGRLDDVTCVLDGGAPLVRLHVPPGQAPGTYEGLLVDEDSNRPVGSVSVTVSDGRGTQPSRSRRARASRASPSSKPSSKRR